MPLASTILVPELQYYFGYYVKNSIVNKYQVPFPVEIPPSVCPCISPKNFIRLLFDDSWPTNYNEYMYLYREDTSRYTWPSIVKDRIMIYSNSAKAYICDSSATCTINFFNLKQDDLTLLDRLLLYRTIDGTTNVIIDIDYDQLSTTLSKMIYLFLDLMINHNYSRYNTSTPLADEDNLLECCYEIYLLDKMFNYISGRGT